MVEIVNQQESETDSYAYVNLAIQELIVKRVEFFSLNF
jgi:hypothetical protein